MIQSGNSNELVYINNPSEIDIIFYLGKIFFIR